MERYLGLHVQGTDEYLIGILSQFSFESFEERETEIVAFLKEIDATDEMREEVNSLLSGLEVVFFWETIEPQNWNALWEASFSPVRVSDFCQVRALFHPTDASYTYDLIIQPKMAFGTGHHATTHMMIELMSTVNFAGKHVFDFGCGTGILAILARKMGAAFADAVDIEQESYLNTIENAEINQVDQIHPFWGDLAAVPEKQYDIILANINRNTLIKYAAELKERMSDGATLLFSGVLEEDVPSVVDRFSDVGLSQFGNLSKNGWAAVVMKRT